MDQKRLAAASRLRDAREKAKWTHAQLAEKLGVSEADVRAWESGEKRIPGFMLETAQLEVFGQRSGELLRAAGVPECPWFLEWEAKDITGLDDDGIDAHFKGMETHTDNCDICRRQNEVLRANAGSLPVMSRFEVPAEFRVTRFFGNVFSGFSGFGPLVILGAIAVVALGIRALPFWLGFTFVLAWLGLGAAATTGIWISKATKSLRRLGLPGRWLSGAILGWRHDGHDSNDDCGRIQPRQGADASHEVKCHK